jgi:thioredoxin reductase (NADPH)
VLRDFLGRNQVAYQWVDVRAGEESERSPVGVELEGKKLPLVVLPDGTELEEPIEPTISAQRVSG